MWCPFSRENKLKHVIPSNTALLIVDVQQGFDDPKWGRRNNLNAEANISRLIGFWRSERRPVIHIQHCSVEPDSPLRPEVPGFEFKPEAMPEDIHAVHIASLNGEFCKIITTDFHISA